MEALQRAQTPNLPPAQVAEVAGSLLRLIRPGSPHVVDLCRALADLWDRSQEGTGLGNLEPLDPSIVRALPAEAQSQIHYAQALGFGAADQIDLAARELLLAENAITAPRCNRAIAILTEAARLYRKSEDFNQPYGSLENAQMAEKLYTLAFRLASRASLPVPVTVRIGLALAAAATGKTEPCVDLVKECWSARTNELGNDAGQLVLLSAGALSGTAKGEALAQYAWSAEHLKPAIGEDPSKFDFYYTRVLQPATTLGSQLLTTDANPKSKMELARVYSALGNVVSENLDSRWLKKKLGSAPPLQVALDAYSKAVTLDPSNANHRVGKAITEIALPKPDWNRLRADAEAALKLKPDSPDVYNLRGFINKQRIGTMDRLPDRAASLREAIDDFNKGIDLSRRNGGNSPILSTLLTNQAIALVELGNYTTDPKERTSSLEKGRESALEATRLPSSYPEYPWEALGNACEDIAMFLGKTDRYAQAVQAFNVAINKLTARFSDRKQPLVSRGRCEYRWASSKEPPDQRRLREALVDLKEVANSASASVAERVEAYYFLGLAQERIDTEMNNAQASLERAVGLDEANKLGIWAPYGLEKLSQWKVQRRDFSGAREAAKRLERYDYRQGKLLAARAWESEGKWKESLQSLRDALPRDLNHATSEDAKLMVKAASLIVDQDESDQKQFEDAAQLADRAAQLASEDSVRAEAKGTAGAAQWKLADAPSDDESRKISLRKSCMADLAAAIKLDAGCRAAHGVEWRVLFASLVLTHGDASQKNKWKQDMLSSLAEADKVVPVNEADTKKRLRILLDKVESLGQ
jgi:hypothetical protein